MALRTIESPDVRKIRTDLGFNTDLMGLVVETASRTVVRWEKTGVPDEAPPQTYGRIAKLVELVQLGQAVYGRDGFKRFLKTPLPAFGGKAAYQLMLLGETDRVLAELAADYEGGGAR